MNEKIKNNWLTRITGDPFADTIAPVRVSRIGMQHAPGR